MKTLIMVIGFVLVESLAGQASNGVPGEKNNTENVTVSKTDHSTGKKTTRTKKTDKKNPHSTVKRSKI